ncbi:oligopeptidase B [Fistulifera solaris]|uniref:Prolyl endopeptidase-like n=1 Tax=Fistulifera solaris TaxID=1519565 RepID=A0A1Z5JGN6_FISSO|nr:oligopeptidase B [Fistulifera solaris]|eukprot:GAX13167.1 oligopeptidase B [Fistulifera solaris]
MLVSFQQVSSFFIISNIGFLRSATAFLVKHHPRQPYSRAIASSLTTLRGGSSNNMSTTATPPVARRDEDAVYYTGVAPPGWDLKYPRQGMNSPEPLLDPPVATPNPYGWMRDDKRDKEEVQQHLRAENEYTQAVTAHLEGLREELYQEMLSSIQETDYTTPRPDGEYSYYTRTFQGKSYTVHCRAPRPCEDGLIEWDGLAETPILPGEQVVLDVNELAEGKPYCSTGTVKHSPSHKLLAYAADFSGNEICQLFVKDLTTGEIVHQDDDLEIYGSLRWGADDNTIFFLKMDETQRPYQLYRRTLDGSNPDELLFEEKDELFWMGISKSLDGKYLFVQVESKETAEVHYLDLHDASSTLQCIAKRRPKVLYDVEHRNGKWWIQSNVGSLPNMALFTAPAVANCEAQWKLVSVKDADGSMRTVFDGGYDRSLDSVTCFKKHVVAYGRESGLPRIWILSVPSDADNLTESNDAVVAAKMETLQFTEDAYDVSMGSHAEFDTDRMMAVYDSLVTPSQSLEISMDDTSQRKVIKERLVPGYDKSLYGCERTTVTSRDGVTHIPVSIVYRKDVMDDAKNNGTPVNVHLYGYGSYGSSVEADFPCLLTCGLHDPRVQFWEPAKFAATLRHLQSPDSGPVCLKTDMSAGHFSASDRYKYLRELAFDYAFLLDQVGLYTPKKE